MLYFVTGSEFKFKEAQSIVPELSQLEVDLAEIQHLDPKVVIRAKLDEAAKEQEGDFIVEDTSLELDALGGFPGTFVKWMIDQVGVQKMYEITQHVGNNQATARTMIGYRREGQEPLFFEGTLNGTIVSPEGRQGFGFDPIFMPDGFSATFGEMDYDEKIQFSMRTEAFKKLRFYLDRKAEQ